MPERDPLLIGLSCLMAVGCFASISVMNVAFILALIVLVVRVERNGWKLQRLPGIDQAILLYAAAFVLSATMGVDPQGSFEYITGLLTVVDIVVIMNVCPTAGAFSSDPTATAPAADLRSVRRLTVSISILPCVFRISRLIRIPNS